MCGIIGFFSKGAESPTEERLKTAADTLRHRGPDEDGYYYHPPIGLGFRRLAIIDLAGGSQPIANEDKTVWVVFNGEIYNFRELREELTGRGHYFKTRSDSEVIAHLYEDQGEELFKYLDGMFAIAIYDVREKRLVLGRDRLGKKPLVFAETPTGFYFASEIAALLKLGVVSREVDMEALSLYLSLQYIPSPHTIFREVRKLMPGRRMIVDRGSIISQKPYWELPVPTDHERPANYEEAIEVLRDRFITAVRRRLVSDVPLGAFLSGGVDSSITVATMAQICNDPVQTFSIGFSDKAFDETRYAAQIAERFGTKHRQFEAKAADLEILKKAVGVMGEPFADQSIIPTYLVAHHTRQYVTVALSGDGGDELFAGYKRYRQLNRVHRLAEAGMLGLWKAARALSVNIERRVNPRRAHIRFPNGPVDEILELPEQQRYLRLLGFFSAPQQELLWPAGPGQKPAIAYLERLRQGPVGYVEQLIQMDIRSYLPEDILYKVDIASMMNSLECRAPFLDHEFVELMVKIPSQWKLQRGGGKKVLKDAFSDLIPPSFFERPKKGFSMPIGRWIREKWEAEFEEVLSTSMPPFFDRDYVRRLLEAHIAGSQDYSNLLWALYVLGLWNKQFDPVWDS
jgi:asparagine synthase (glutamine-hydrolysing)